MSSISIRQFCLLLSVVILSSTQGATAQTADSQVDERWKPVVAVLQQRIAHEMADKQLPALAIALVDDQHVVWAQGFGYQDAKHTIPATADTVFRVGSVSKLFTDIGIMQLVQAGRLNLDAPVSNYLPNFHPVNPFDQPITLRQLMSHRAGLVREPPVGNYFDTSAPTLQQTVDSLNQTTLVYPPGSHTKYSNAGVATVGYTLQTISGEPYATYLKRAVLQPLGMTHSAFEQEPALMSHLADAFMWSYDGLNFQAPTFQLGEGPAGCMYSTVGDLGRFLSVLFAGGKSGDTQVIQPGTLAEMWRPQFPGASTRQFGLGFALGTLDGNREIGHGGAIYGFATQVAGLPDQKLGVVVIATADGTNAVVNRIGDDALRLMLSVRNHQPLPRLLTDKEIRPDIALKADGHYSNDKEEVVLKDEEGHLFLSNPAGGGSLELKDEGTHWIEDGRVAYDPEPIIFTDDGGKSDTLKIGATTYHREILPPPAPAPAALKEFVGEYGWSFDKLYVLEDRGRLNLLIEWFEFAPLDQQTHDTFRFSEKGLYQGELATFQRAADGTVTGVKVGGVLFPRLPLNEDGAVFQIKPLKPVDQLRKEALASKPPVESGNFHPTDLVELTKLDPTIKLDIRYATSRNFLGAPLYLQPRAYMQRPAAEAVVRASRALHKLGFGLLVHDSYRPWYVTKMFWDGTPDDKKIFVADPAQGSRHNRGCAVDLTLYDLNTGKPIVMTGGYDEMSERSYPFYPGGTGLQRWHRDVLRRAMEHEGFTVYTFEWWHFDYFDFPHYRISNLTFEELDKAAAK
jgi:CubicO group peptidase (beta-lactamase class C family)/D-alanyl-D-alanine dipeptidase